MIDIKKVCESRFKREEEYLGTNKLINQINPLVSVTVTTYQHANYIKDCLEGILMQKTNFPFEIIIGEDESTDGTREICIEYAEKYPDKIRLFLRKRETSQLYDENGKFITRFNGHWNRMSARGKYIAWCEGDDYWIDPYKLQKQVDFLEENPEYGIVFTDANILIEQTSKIIYNYDKKFKRKIPEGDVLNILLYDNPYKTCTSLFRSVFIKSIDNSIFNNLKMGDIVLWLLIGSKSKFKYIPEATAVYRVRNESASRSNDINKIKSFLKSRYKISLFFSEYNNISIKKDKFKKNYREYILSLYIQKNELTSLEEYKNYPISILKVFLKEKIIKPFLIFIQK